KSRAFLLEKISSAGFSCKKAIRAFSETAYLRISSASFGSFNFSSSSFNSNEGLINSLANDWRKSSFARLAREHNAPINSGGKNVMLYTDLSRLVKKGEIKCWSSWLSPKSSNTGANFSNSSIIFFLQRALEFFYGLFQVAKNFLFPRTQ